MNKRHVLAAVLVTVGILLIVGAVGSMEYGSIGVGETLIRAGIGFALIGAAVPASGELKGDYHDEK